MRLCTARMSSDENVAKLVQLQGISQCCPTPQHAPPVIDVVPIARTIIAYIVK